MKVVTNRAIRRFQKQARLHQALQSALTPIFSLRSRHKVRVCAVKSGCLILQLAHSAMVFELRKQLPSLLATARTVSCTISRIDFVVRPLSMLPIFPAQDYQIKCAQALPRELPQ